MRGGPRVRRKSLLARLLAVTAVVAAISVGATAWLASTTATRYDLQVAAENAELDARIVDELVGYAATHPSWDRVQPVLDELARETGRRIAVHDTRGETIGDTRPDLPLPAWDAARVDALSVATADTSRQIDPRAVGPYRLSPAERSALDALALEIGECLGPQTDWTVEHQPSGRPRLLSDDSTRECGDERLLEPVPAEAAALAELVTSTNACLAALGQSPISSISVDFEAQSTEDASDAELERVAQCVDVARAQQLQPWVAPPVDVVITDARGDERGPADLTRGSVARIALIVVGILVLVLGVSALVGLPLIRRVQALTVAAERMAAGESGTAVPVRGDDEIAQLAIAFNEMSRLREHSERLRTQLISDVAHELRTPLTNLLGWLEAAEDGVAEHDADLTRLLLAETHQLTRIVADLQTLTLADAGELKLRDDELDVGDLIASVADTHRLRAEAAAVALDSSVEPGLELRGDGGRIRQVLDNLVANALDHTPAGGSVSLTAQSADGRVLLRVRDTGEGIAPEDQRSVFERFWRADRSRARVSGGSGLGLAIVRDVVDAHGGRISVDSELGRGSEFVVDLPGLTPPSASSRGAAASAR